MTVRRPHPNLERRFLARRGRIGYSAARHSGTCAVAAGIHDWNAADSWTSEHPVVDAFGRLRARVAEGRLSDTAHLPRRLSQAQRRVLRAGLERMAASEVRGGVDAAARQVLDAMAAPATAAQGTAWRGLAPTLGLAAGALDADQAIAEGRHYLVAQLLAMSPKHWSDPVGAILFSAAHYGLEVALRRKRSKPEPLKTEALLHHLHSAVEEHLIPAMDKSGAHLPEACTLDLGTASMQEGRDLLAADLAVVAGVNVLGRPMYRIVLFQAKNVTATGAADIGRDEGRQLDRLLSTGMGCYLFYPAAAARGSFIPTVRTATAVYREVWDDAFPPAFGRVDAYGDERAPGWDFAAFVSVAMSSARDLTLGRLFFDAESAARALADDRKQPLAAALIAFDRTGSLRLRDFIDATASVGYGDQRFLSCPSERRPVHRHDAPGFPG
ncbi:hypothetical protein ACXIT0_03430 [Methylorubrum extorquens]